MDMFGFVAVKAIKEKPGRPFNSSNSWHNNFSVIIILIEQLTASIREIPIGLQVSVKMKNSHTLAGWVSFKISIPFLGE